MQLIGTDLTYQVDDNSTTCEQSSSDSDDDKNKMNQIRLE